VVYGSNGTVISGNSSQSRAGIIGTVPSSPSSAGIRIGFSRWKTLHDHGIRVQFGSDAPVEPIAPLLGVRAAMLRQDPAGRPEGGWRPDQCLTLFESLAGYFQTAAWTTGREGVLGAIAPGYWADVTIFQTDLCRLPPAEWPATAVEMTIVGGEIVSANGKLAHDP
ncbi:MAG: amidohydrolase family protein, partial [Desulfosarcina sp.]